MGQRVGRGPLGLVPPTFESRNRRTGYAGSSRKTLLRETRSESVDGKWRPCFLIHREKDDTVRNGKSAEFTVPFSEAETPWT